MTKEDIKARLINNDALFKNIYVFEQQFDIVPEDRKHYGAAVSYQDIMELRSDFLEQLIDTVVDWVYSSEKYAALKAKFIESGKSEGAAVSQVVRKAKAKFRRGDDKLLIQGQLGELLLFHFIQRFKGAVPLLRKMPITTSAEHERYGADAVHYKIENGKNVIVQKHTQANISSLQHLKRLLTVFLIHIKSFAANLDCIYMKIFWIRIWMPLQKAFLRILCLM